jgi:hypothetical protein
MARLSDDEITEAPPLGHRRCDSDRIVRDFGADDHAGDGRG